MDPVCICKGLDPRDGKTTHSHHSSCPRAKPFEEMTPGIREANAMANQRLKEILRQREKTMLTFDEYQESTTHTRIYRDSIRTILMGLGIEGDALQAVTKLLSTSYAGLGLGETGEVQGKLKKIIRDSGGVIDDDVRQKIAGELGDCLWYVAATAEEFDLSLGDIAQANLDKLADRRERGVIQGSGDNR